jgi:hypothetical protein
MNVTVRLLGAIWVCALLVIGIFGFSPIGAERERLLEDPERRAAVLGEGLKEHIPWPNFEAFGICPWQDEILDGMLAADLIGFHTQYHGNNFLETDADRFAVVRGDHHTDVQPFPISVAPEFVDSQPGSSRRGLLAELGVTAEFLGVGVERVDDTKGPNSSASWPASVKPSLQLASEVAHQGG